MEKRIVYIAYLIIAFVVFNFLFGFTDIIGAWQVWNWYLVILLLVMGVLLFIKYKQNQRKFEINERIKETDRCRLQLNQFLLLEQFEQLDNDKFNQFLKKFYNLKGYESIEISSDREKLGYDLIMWSENEKIMFKWFRHAPLMTSLYSEADAQFESGEPVGIQEIREAYGVMNDFEVQADKLILLSTNGFDEEALDFASRNNIIMMNGEDFYHELENIREPKGYTSEVFAG